MAFNEHLGERVRALLIERHEVIERRMFGGLAFMLRGHMVCGIVGEELMVRTGDNAALTEPYTRPMDFTGRPFPGYVFVAGRALKRNDQLRRWLERAIAFNETLPIKRPRKR